ncbi:Anaphase-promoting complex subunit 4 WD40 [Gracilaria domingensis]|nr:Anaphase-promoting complex subunit 4 WD40 [Gracilaria domingensis]
MKGMDRDAAQVIRGAVFSQSTNRLITFHNNCVILVWDCESGYQFERRIKIDQLGILSVAVSTDERKIACLCSGGKVLIVDMHSGETLRDDIQRQEFMLSLVQNPEIAASFDGSRIVCAVGPLGFMGWVLPDERNVVAMLTPTEMRGYATYVAMSEDGNRVACASEYHSVLVWDVDATKCWELDTTNLTKGITCISIRSDGGLVVCGTEDGTICVWNAESGRRISQRFDNELHARIVSVAVDGHEVVWANVHGKVGLWDLESSLLESSRRNERTDLNQYIATFMEHFENSLTDVETSANRSWNRAGARYIAYCGEGPRVLVLFPDRGVVVLDVESGKLITRQVRTALVSHAALSENGNRMVFISGSMAHVLDTKSGKAVEVISVQGFPHGLAVSNDGTRIIVCGTHGLDVYDVVKGYGEINLEKRIAHLADGSVSTALSGDGTHVASTSRMDSDVRVWKVCTDGRVPRPVLLRGHTGRVLCLAWSMGTNRVVSASVDKTLRVWDVRSGAAVCELLVCDDPRVYHIQTDTHGLRFVSYDDAGNGRLWNISSRACEMKSSDPAWAATLHRLELARVCLRAVNGRRKITQRDDATGSELVLATPDWPVLQIGDTYVCLQHEPSSVQFCRVVR